MRCSQVTNRPCRSRVLPLLLSDGAVDGDLAGELAAELAPAQQLHPPGPGGCNRPTCPASTVDVDRGRSLSGLQPPSLSEDDVERDSYDDHDGG